jgi:uncharacterized protein (DUF2235 family)
MTRIAVFCDGTWNSSKLDEPTNIFKLQQALESDPSKGQVSVYFAGIGTDRRFDGATKQRWLGRLLNKYGGGAFGWGLDDKVKQAYQFLCLSYQPGDEIYLFGFSRGAYTARSVAGMIRKCGLIDNPTEARINQAFALYRMTGTKNAPDAQHIMVERQNMSPRFATSKNDLMWRGTGEIVQIAYLGVFDTVGARGMPPSLFGPVAALWNSQYRFHDMKLTSLVKSARHALALDERRVFFVPAKWDNLDNTGSNMGLNKGVTDANRPYQQEWFAGDHSIIGGSAKEQPLSAITLNWIFAGAGELTLKAGRSFPPTAPDASFHAPRLKGRWSPLKKWREGPQAKWELNTSVNERISKVASYRPRSLFGYLKRWGQG